MCEKQKDGDRASLVGKHVLIHGAYNANNFGDTLLLKLLSDRMLVEGFVVYVSNACSDTLSSLDSRVLELAEKPVREKIDVLIYGGGGYFGEQPVGRLKWHMRFIKTHIWRGYCSIFLRHQTVFSGVDFGPLSCWLSRFLARRIWNRSIFIGARNFESANFLRNQGVLGEIVCETADAALLTSELMNVDQSTSNAAGGRRRIIIHPSFSLESTLQRRIADEIKSTLCGRDDIELCIMADSSGPDVAQRLMSWASYLDVPNRSVFYYSGLNSTVALIASSYAVITNKLHVAIVAGSYGKQVISLAKHPKNLRFFNQIMRPELCLMLGELDFLRLDDLLVSLANGILLPVHLDESVKKMARANFNFIDLLAN